MDIFGGCAKKPIMGSYNLWKEAGINNPESFTQPIILIAGGSEKNADYGELGQAITDSSVKTAILIGETGPRIKSKVKSKNLNVYDSCQNLNEVMVIVKKEAKSGDVVLLSPASASFDWFSSYKDRGQQFKQLVLKELM